MHLFPTSLALKGSRMKSLQHYIDEMNRLLKELIEISTKLRDVSRQVISEEELAPLQKHQQVLLGELEKVDLVIQESYRHQIDSVTHQHFHDQLHHFQMLNQEFIQNLHTNHGLIQFESSHLREENQEREININHLLLNKMPLSPNSTQAIKSEESEKT
jgi:hypothetical protein